MADNTGIEWTDATWNPIVGCSIVSPGCTNCYAMKMAARIEKIQPQSHYAGTTKSVNGRSVWTGKMALAPDHILTAPLRWKKPRRIFVNSMGDLFHEAIPDEWIDKVFAVMEGAYWHTYQVLTKRSARMRSYVSKRHCGASLPRQIWLGVSAEDQTRADERIPDLLDTPAAVRFVSAEPLLSAVDFTSIKVGGDDSLYRANALTGDGFDGQLLSWIIVGGESGPGARPMHPDWVRAIRDQCQAAGVPFFFKQWGQWAPWDDDNWSLPDGWDDVEAHDKAITIDGVEFLSVGKRRAGRLLDGREWREFPK